jgi:hypothetical protein
MQRLVLFAKIDVTDFSRKPLTLKTLRGRHNHPQKVENEKLRYDYWVKTDPAVTEQTEKQLAISNYELERKRPVRKSSKKRKLRI